MFIKRFTIRSLILLTTLVAILLWIVLREPAFGFVLVASLLFFGMLLLAYAAAFFALSLLAPLYKLIVPEPQPKAPFAANPTPSQGNAE